MRHLAHARLVLSLALLLLGALACGGDEGPRARWTFEIGPFAEPGMPPAPTVAPAALAELPEQVLQRLPKRFRRATSVRIEGERTLVVEGPLALDRTDAEPEAALASALEPEDRDLRLVAPLGRLKAEVLAAAGNENDGSFPARGGVIQIGTEWIAYARREGAQLLELERGAFGTPVAAHPVGAPVPRVASDELARRLGRSGSLRFLVDASCAKIGAPVDRLAANQRLEAWRASCPDAPLADYNDVLFEDGGPLPGTVWCTMRWRRQVEERVHLLVVPERPFTERDLERVEPYSQESAFLALLLELTEKRKAEFGDFTESIIDCGLAIVLDGEVVTLATVTSRLPGSCVIEGGGMGFTANEAQEIIQLLRAGPLAAPLRFVKREAMVKR